MSHVNIKLIVLTLLSLIAFTGNSLLCRMALKFTEIDPSSFSMIRIISGAFVLWAVLAIRKNPKKLEGNWLGSIALFTYATSFAYAYAEISAGTGALILFGAIQVTMVLIGLRMGERLSAIQTLGLCIAVSGLILLMWPSIEAPPFFYGLLMLLSGFAWGVFSLLGKGVKSPVSAMAGNFIRAMPIAILFWLISTPSWNLETDIIGVQYAIFSGAITSGLGYILWYAALKKLDITHAATVQLSVPIITAVGGALFLDEAVTQLLVLSSIAIISGIAIVILSPKPQSTACSTITKQDTHH